MECFPALPDPITKVADPKLPTGGMPWFSAGGFAGSDPKSNPTIVDDTPDGLPDSVHINTGLALALEGKGRETNIFDRIFRSHTDPRRGE